MKNILDNVGIFCILSLSKIEERVRLSFLAKGL